MDKGYGISEEIWRAMEQLVREGKISYVGSSSVATWDVALAQCAASARHFTGLTSQAEPIRGTAHSLGGVASRGDCPR